MNETTPSVPNQALPYVDRELDDPTMASRVEELIRQEMGKGEGPTPVSSYAMSFPDSSLMGKLFYTSRFQAVGSILFHSFFFLSLSASEFERMESGISMPRLDLSRYEMELPSETMLEDHHAWRKRFVKAFYWTDVVFIVFHVSSFAVF